MPRSDSAKFEVEYELAWNINLRELLPDNPLDIVKEVDSRLFEKLERLNQVGQASDLKAELESTVDEPLELTIHGRAEVEIELPDDTEGMSDDDIEAELEYNAGEELAKQLGVQTSDVTIKSIRHD